MQAMSFAKVRTLFLGIPSPRVLSALTNYGSVTVETRPVGSQTAAYYDIAISFGYRHILSKAFCEAWLGRAFNVHLSALPWNRGASPNLFSWLDCTPMGVSIHYISPELDKGDIAYQHKYLYGKEHTLRSSYDSLARHAENLLILNFLTMVNESAPRKKQESPGGSYNSKAKAKAILDLLPLGYDTPVKDLIGKRNYFEKLIQGNSKKCD